MLLAGLRVITARNPVHGVLFLVLAFFTAAGLWLLLRAEFLAIALVVVYVGAVMVLFLFVVMMLDINLERVREGFWRNLPLAGVVAAVIVLEMWLVLSHGGWQFMTQPGEGVAKAASNTEALGRCSTPSTCIRFEIARLHPAGGDHRRDRAHPAPAQGQQVPAAVGAGQGAPRGSRAPRADGRRAREPGTPPASEARRTAKNGGGREAAERQKREDQAHGVLVLVSGSRRAPVRDQRGRHLPQPPQPDRAADGDRADAARGQPQLHRLLALPRRLPGQVFVFFILTVAAAESAIGLAILVVLFRNLTTINVDDLDALKG